MRSRGFNKRVEIWNTTLVPDGYGGNTIQETLLSSSWCNIKSVKASSGNFSTEFGLLNASKSIIVTFRKRNDLTYNFQTMYVKYRNERYVIKSYPNNVDFEDSIIQMVCTKESDVADGNDLNANLNVS